MKILLLFIASFFFLKSDKQEYIVDKEVVLKPGFYRDFQEFKTNSPSVAFNNSPLTTVTKGYGFLNATGEVVYYRVSMEKSLARKIGNVYGFCDGKSIYLNPEISVFRPNMKFSKLDYLGRYCYFEDLMYKSVPTGNGMASNTYLAEKALDINTGEITILSKKTLKEIIAKDAALLEDFTNETKKNKVLKDYLISYSDKHINEISRL
ncbi:hypothetical protein [Adhaeribacter pallidiroseus]|uniref:WG repeat-containing protein n=1 Tax=Adhaeribacter pallidiroseus TaxID=2072847 RepID=A0A369QKL8_9BACT|nr:hypothetical protein [Adhaeribacter pallidiroseus]RDC63797.1 hypothetical protein AHMF7616_02406 [Adhaeribacter pallidiroseus]